MKNPTFRSLSVLFALAFAGTVRAQDTLSPTTACYADILDDWKDQDQATSGYRTAITAIIPTLPVSDRAALQARLDALASSASNSPEMEKLYVRTCSARRAMRMASYVNKFKQVVFSQHNVRGSFYFNADVWSQGGYAGKGIELLGMTGYYGTVTHLLPTGEARDPDVSFDGKRILFSWRGGASNTSEYHLFEMNVATRAVRAITTTSAATVGYQWGCIDYEGIYLPNGNILFTTTRGIQEIDCISGPAVNFFICDKDGKYLRRLCSDQVPTDYPQVLPDGRVVYCRWDYNDKSHTYGHALFVMNPDGTAQREYYNNNSWWPTMILQARPIPGTTKLMAMIGGYHTPRSGKIGIIDINVGRENGHGLTLVAPVRLPKDDNIDTWGGNGEVSGYVYDWTDFPRANAWPVDQWGQVPPIFAYPYPFDEKAFLVSYRPASKQSAWADRFGLYFMTVDGKRELLYWDAAGSCCAPVVLAPRTVPVLSSTVDYRKTTAEFQIMNLYDPRNSQSPVLNGIDPKIIKRIRVAALEWRSGPAVGGSGHFGAACINFGGATYHTAISTGGSSWDLKWILGETPVLSDGSAAFLVPARTPIFFQMLDAKGNVVQTMRSWSTLEPGETFSCMGCHESQLSPPPPLSYVPLAIQRGAVALEPFYGPARGFSFAKEIQPILNAKCISCHSAATPNGIDLTGVKVRDDGAGRSWLRSYSNLVRNTGVPYNKYVNWFVSEDSPLLQKPYRAGACKSGMITLLEAGHKDIVMTREEMDKLRCWIDLGIPHSGAYTEGMNAGDSTNTARNLAYRRAWEAEEKKNISAYLLTVGTIGNGNDRQSKSSLPIDERWTMTAGFSASHSLKVAFFVPRRADRQPVQISVHTMRGALVATLMKERTAAGYYARSFQMPTSGGAGQYLVRIKAGGFEKAVPVVIVK